MHRGLLKHRSNDHKDQGTRVVNVLLVDVCHTLYDANTTYGFLDQYLAHDPRYIELAKQRRSFSQRVRARLLTRPDVIRNQAVALLKGASRVSLLESAKAYVHRIARIESVQSYINERQAEGMSIYLVSSSLDFIVAEVAMELGVDGWFASVLEFEKDICTGVLETDLTGNKNRVLHEHFPEASAIEFVSDNFSDANCIPLVESFRPVYPKRNIRARVFWSGKNVGEPIYG
ncbi:MAG: HAD superfamily phosphoserine phosphatase-like hydrolase [Patiriisocius sp.]